MSNTNQQRKTFVKWRTDLAIHDALGLARRQSLLPWFRRLLTAALSRSDLLRPRPVGGNAGWTQTELALRGLLALSRHQRNWLRLAEAWDPPAEGPYRQLASLASHLLSSHAVPGFMANVWIEEPSPLAFKHQKLFKHLGLGNSIRGADLPISVSKAMANFFPRAPDHLTVEQALRWSQVRALGGSREFALDIIQTRLGGQFEPEDYWSRAIEFLIGRSDLDRAMIAPIVDYLDHKRGTFFPNPFHRFTERRFALFLQDVRKWMRSSWLYGRRPRLKWTKTGIGGFRYVEPNKNPWSFKYWTIHELASSRELIDEGNRQHHCVGSFVWSCWLGRTSIWSLRCHGSLETRRVLTIEVDPKARRIVTALGKCNSSPQSDARNVMEMWAESEALEIAKWV